MPKCLSRASDEKYGSYIYSVRFTETCHTQRRRRERGADVLNKTALIQPLALYKYEQYHRFSQHKSTNANDAQRRSRSF